MGMRNNKKEIVYIPLLDNIEYIELHPSINFNDVAMIGVWLPSKDVESHRVVKRLWFWDGNALVDAIKYLKDNNCFLKSKMSYFEKRMSDLLLKCGANENFLKNLYKIISTGNEATLISSGKFDKERKKMENNECSHNSDFDYKPTSCEHMNIVLGGTNAKSTSHEHMNVCILKSLTIDIGEVMNICKEKNNKLVTLKFIHSYIHNKLKYYIDLEKEEDYDLITLWCIGTYFFDLFDVYPYLFIHGVKRSGKTTVLKVLEKICFNAIMTGSITASSVFRLADSLKPTLLIDETDALSSARNKPDLHQILLNGYKKGATITRTRKKETDLDFEVERFDVYCPKALVNIRGLEDVLEDRTIYLNLKRTINKEYANRVTNISKDADWQIIRDLLYFCLFNCWKQVAKEYNTMQNETCLTNRDWELWKPLLVLAKLVGIYAKMVSFAEVKSREKITEDVTEQRDSIIAQVLYDNIKEDGYYLLKDITNWVKDRMEEEEKIKLTSRAVGSSLRRLGFSEKKRTTYGIQYFLKVQEVQKMAKRMDVIESEKETQVKQVSDVPLSEQIEKFLMDTVGNKEYSLVKLIEKDCVEKFGEENKDLCFDIFMKMKERGVFMDVDLDKIKKV